MEPVYNVHRKVDHKEILQFVKYGFDFMESD